MDEAWRSIPGYEGLYDASNLGRIRTLRSSPPRILKPAVRQSGHLSVALHKGGKHKCALVHRLVLFAFVGAAPEGHECRHLNGRPADNRLSNLKWGTHSENMQDAVRHGTHASTAKDCCPKGHPYDEENTIYQGPGWRHCRTCRTGSPIRRPRKRAVPRVKKPRPRKEHCPRGHPLDETNTYVRPNGVRECRECKRTANREGSRLRRARKRATALD